MLALLFRSRTRRMRRVGSESGIFTREGQGDPQPGEVVVKPIYVSREAFMGMPTLAHPQGKSVKRVRVQ